MRRIYLDYNATTPVSPSVIEAMTPFLTEHFGNPSSSHALGIVAREAVADARGQVANLIGADPDEIVFTSGGTESNNLALRGILESDDQQPPGHLVISTLEHPAIKAPASRLEQRGVRVSRIECTPDGVVDVQMLADTLSDDTQLVSIMHANNEIGTIQPIAQIAQLCHDRDILLHTDAAQSTGKIAVDVTQLDVDLLSVAGHKLYAPKGIGVLYVRRNVALASILYGAGQEQGLRPGTENVAAIVAIGCAARLAQAGLDGEVRRIEKLRDRLMDDLMAEIGARLTFNGIDAAARLPNTLSVNFPDVAGADLLRRCPELCASTGAACHANQVAMSDVLHAISLPADQARGTVRLSLGWYTSEEDIQRAIELLTSAWHALSS